MAALNRYDAQEAEDRAQAREIARIEAELKQQFLEQEVEADYEALEEQIANREAFLKRHLERAEATAGEDLRLRLKARQDKLKADLLAGQIEIARLKEAAAIEAAKSKSLEKAALNGPASQAIAIVDPDLSARSALQMQLAKELQIFASYATAKVAQGARTKVNVHTINAVFTAALDLMLLYRKIIPGIQQERNDKLLLYACIQFVLQQNPSINMKLKDKAFSNQFPLLVSFFGTPAALQNIYNQLQAQHFESLARLRIA